MGVSRVLLIHLMLFSCGDSRNIGKHREIEGIRIFKKKNLTGVAMRKTTHQKQ